MQTQITHRCVIEEETEELGEKPLRRPPSSNRSTRQSVEIHGLARDPSSLIYLLYLSPPSSYSKKTSRNRVLSSSVFGLSISQWYGNGEVRVEEIHKHMCRDIWVR